MLFFITADSTFSVVRTFQGTTPAEGTGHGQQAWAALRKKFDGCLRAAIRAEYIRTTNMRMRPGKDPDDYLYHMGSCRDRLNACGPPEDSMDRQYEDIILQALLSEYDRSRQTHLERRNFGLADIRRMMTAIYADNLSRSESSKGIAGRGAAMQAVDRDRTSVLCHYCDQFGHFKKKCLLRIKHKQQQRQQPVRHHQQQQRSQHQQKPRGLRQNNGGGGGGRVWCSYPKTTSHNDADCRVQQHKAGGNAHVAATRTQCVKGVCSAYDLPEQDDEPERPYISFMATEVQSKTKTATTPRQKNSTWPFGLLTMARPWPFVEREKSAISLGGQDEPNFSYMYGGTDGEGEPLYDTTLMASVSGVFKHKPSVGDDSVTSLVDSGASGHYFGDLIIPSLKYRLLDYVLLTTPRKILTAEGALLGGTPEGILQGFVTDNHGEQSLARIDILIVSGIGCNPFSVKSATKKGVVSIFDFDNPRLELSGITDPLRAEDDLYSLVLKLSADSHGGKELAMNAMTNA